MNLLSLIKNNKLNLFLFILTLDTVIRLGLKAENVWQIILILFASSLILKTMCIGNDEHHIKYLLVFISGCLFLLSFHLISLEFFYLLTFLYSILLVYAFLLPNSYFTLAFTGPFILLLFKYDNQVGFDAIQGNIIGLVVNSLIYSVIVSLIKKLQVKNEMLEQTQVETTKFLSLLPEPVFVHNNDVVFYTNQEGLKLVGAEHLTDVIGKSPLHYIHKHYCDNVTERMKIVIGQNSVSRNNIYKLVKKNGDIIDIDCSSTNFTYKGKTALITLVRDITYNKQATDELIRKSDKLKIVGQMAAGIAHEIKNPLTSIRGFLQLLREPSPKTPEYIDTMLGEIDRINLIVNEFLILAKPQAIRYCDVDILTLIDKADRLLHSQSVQNNVEVRVEVEEDIPPIKCDENQIMQVFINVMKNAIEAMPSGGNLTIHLEMKDSHNVMITFVDNGVGIAEDRLPTIGEPFYSTKETGTGLGLMVSYKIVESHFGYIRISSRENIGTTLNIILPLSVEHLLKNDNGVNSTGYNVS